MVDEPLRRLEQMFGQPRPVDGLAPEAVLQLSGEFPVRDLSAEARVLAARFAGAEIAGLAEPDKRLCWHHLLMAASNMKGRGAGVHAGNGKCFLDDVEGVELPSFRLPRPVQSGEVIQPVVSRDEPGSWRALTDSVEGMTVVTATALLAALWPDSHAVIDNINVGTVIGLQAMDPSGMPHGNLTMSELNTIWRAAVAGAKTWDDYEWYLGTLRATALQPSFGRLGVGLVELERAFSLMGARAAGYGATQWAEWSVRLRNMLETATGAWSG